MTWPLDARELGIWLERYNRAMMSYVRGVTNAEAARKLLRDLRFRDEALQIEMLEWERLKRKRKSAALRKARKELNEYFGPLTGNSSEAETP